MIAVQINRVHFEYDVNSLVKAFFPEDTVKVITPETGQKKRDSWKESLKLDIVFRGGGATVRSWLEKTMPDERAADGGKEALAGQEPESGREALAGQEPESGRGALAGQEPESGREALAGQEPESGREALAGQEPESGREALAGQEPDVSGPLSCPEIWEWRYEKEWEEGDSYKNAFKRFLYLKLSNLTGKELPWGALTGIRPTKLSYGLLEEGKKEEEILAFYRKKYFASEKKAQLSIEIAKRERELLSKIHYEGGYSLYIGIPFCPTTCLYCSFPSFAIGAYREKVEEYIDCLVREMEFVSEKYRHKILDSVYIGGGTPTTLEPEQLDRLLGNLRRLFDFTTVQEFTVEAGRADSITEKKLEALLRHGVTRISINPQTMKQETLDIIGRRHTVEQVEQAFQMARGLGFGNINMDIILGLPGETSLDVRHTMDRIAFLDPDSLTVHSLAIKRASRMSQWIQDNGVSSLVNTDETMEIAAAGAKRLGLLPYYLYRQKNMSGNFENVGYARPGKFGLYNVLIMEEVQTIVACGAGSISKRVYPDGRIERCENVKEVGLYIEKIDEMIERKRSLLADAEDPLESSKVPKTR